MIKNIGIVFVLAVGLGAGVGVLASGDPVRGKEISQPCVACHGADGNSAANIYPKIAGQHHRYLAEQLKLYRAGVKGGRQGANAAIMYGMSANLSDQDIEDLAAYYESQKTSKGEAAKEFVKLGEALYRGGDLQAGIPACASCHGPRGLGNALARFPKLSGQHAAYTSAQLHAYASGDRKGRGIMHVIAHRMTDEQIKAVSEYVAGLH